MKSVLTAVLLSLLLVSCNQTTEPNIDNEPAKGFDKITELYGLHNDVDLISSPAESILTSGDLAPDFLIRTEDNIEFSLSDLRGKVVYIEFWRTRCSFCVQAMPGMVEATNSIEDEDFVVIAISTDATDNVPKSTVSDFIDDYNMNNFVNVYDGLSANSAIAYQYGIRGTPTGYLINKEGKIAKSLHPASSTFKSSILEELDK
jgi:peroxiredoxin